MPVSNSIAPAAGGSGAVTIDGAGFISIPGDETAVPIKVTKIADRTFAIWVLDGGVPKQIHIGETST